MADDRKPKLTGINHVALKVGDIDAALEFYRQLFDFELRGRHEGAAFLDMGDQFLALMQGRSQAADQARHFGLVVDDRAGLEARVAAAGATLLDTPGLDFIDPWGNRIQVVEYRDIQFTKTEAALSILGVSPEKTQAAQAELRKKGLAG